MQVTKPIFIVGCPKSGTSLLYRRLGVHPDLAWFRKWSRKFPRSVWLSRLAAIRSGRDETPTEGGGVWRAFSRHNDDDALGRGDVTPAARRYYHRVMRTQMALFGRARFLSKHPRNGLRMEYFQEIFPDAVFLHLIRDGRAVAHSIHHVRCLRGDARAYWDIKPPGWRDLLALDPIVSCGLQWRKTVEFIRESGRRLPASQYVEVKYEQFTASPRETLLALSGPCGLSWTAEAMEAAVRGVENRNYKWRQNLDDGQLRSLEAAIGAFNRELGYTED